MQIRLHRSHEGNSHDTMGYFQTHRDLRNCERSTKYFERNDLSNKACMDDQTRLSSCSHGTFKVATY